MKHQLDSKTGIRFVILLGIVSLLADITYEGARSILGPYLSILGANAAIVGAVAGFGELVGYGFRLLSGYLSDKTGRYWLFVIFGYAINLISVPLLALTTNWQTAAALIIAERFGKAIRTPSRDAMLSYATQEMGRGWGFGLHAFLDQMGAIIGPLVISASLFYQQSYQASFAYLLVPALLALTTLLLAKKLYPYPHNLEVANPSLHPDGLAKNYWLGIIATSLVAVGFIDFAIIAYHFQKNDLFPTLWIPLLYAIAMGAEGIASLGLGRLYDLKGMIVLVYSTLISIFFVPLVFMNQFYAVLVGMILWGIGMGAQGTIMRAFVAQLVPPDKRGTAYGILNICFGLSWFLGSALMGILYDHSLNLLIIFSVFIQLASIPLFLILHYQQDEKKKS